MPVLNQGNDSFKNDLGEMYEVLQQQRSVLLDAISELQTDARLLTTLEAQRLEQQRGADDPRVAALRARADTMLERANVLTVEREIAGLRAPPAVKTGAVVQGRITDAQRRAAGRVSVRLVNEHGEPVAGVDPVEVDDAGFYAFVLKPETVSAIGDAKLTVALRDGEKDLVPAAAKPFTVAPGASAPQDVTLSNSELDRLRLRVPDLTPPPADPRPTPPVVPPTQPPVVSPAPPRPETPPVVAPSEPRPQTPPGPARPLGRPATEGRVAPQTLFSPIQPEETEKPAPAEPSPDKPKGDAPKRGSTKKKK
jgi:hypothetical protein